MDGGGPMIALQIYPNAIAKLAIDGHSSSLNVPEGNYTELSDMQLSHNRVKKEYKTAANKVKRWLKSYFPEFLNLYKKLNTVTGMIILEAAPTPQSIISLGVEGIVKIWREHKVRGKGASLHRAKILVEAAHNHLGKHATIGAIMELQMMLEDYKVKERQLAKVSSAMKELIKQVPNEVKMPSVDSICPANTRNIEVQVHLRI